uniref:RuvB-like 2 n=1 Tax=Arundo donax TaxID=35708 RepID=A0A0A9A6Q8_ARUDO
MGIAKSLDALRLRRRLGALLARPLQDRGAYAGLPPRHRRPHQGGGGNHRGRGRRDLHRPPLVRRPRWRKLGRAVRCNCGREDRTTHAEDDGHGDGVRAREKDD